MAQVLEVWALIYEGNFWGIETFNELNPSNMHEEGEKKTIENKIWGNISEDAKKRVFQLLKPANGAHHEIEKESILKWSLFFRSMTWEEV